MQAAAMQYQMVQTQGLCLEVSQHGMVLDEHHGMEKRQYFALSGQEMIEKFGYRECPKR